MTRGHFKGDLAIVKAVKESGLKFIVQCVPRLDYELADLTPEESGGAGPGGGRLGATVSRSAAIDSIPRFGSALLQG